MRTILLITFLSVSIFAIGQHQNNIWYFGKNAGVDFSNGAPVPLSNGATNSVEGAACISDNSGNLLFYAAETYVYNRNHVVMANGSGIHGNSIVAQSSLIVPKPGSPSIFYLFSNDSDSGPSSVYNGLSYAIIDMSLNGGDGGVTSKNNPLITPTSEKMIGIKHSNGIDTWVITHTFTSNNYYAYLVSSSGVNLTPVISSTGSMHDLFYHSNGFLKSTLDGTVLADVLGNTTTDLLNFDAATGIVSYQYTIPAISRAYSIEFSPDGTKLYLGNVFTLGSDPGTVYQYNLLAGDSTDVINSETLVATVNTPNILNSGAVGGMLLGPDDKIYISRSTSQSLAVINNPNNTAATCNFVDHAISLSGNTSYATGIPNSLARGYSSAPCYNVIDTRTECTPLTWIDGITYTASNNTATHTLTDINGCDSIVTLNLTIGSPTNGTDVISTCGIFIWIDGNVYTSNNSTATHTIVNGNSNGCDSIVTLNLTTGSISSGSHVVTACGSYLWIDGNTYTQDNTTAIHTIINGNASGCDSLVTLNLTINGNNVNVTTTINNDSIWSNAINATYQWLDCANNYAVIAGDTNTLFVATANGDYAVQVTQNGCIDTSACVNVNTIIMSIEENSFGNRLQLYPNPTNGKFSIDLGQHYSTATVTITITDVRGKLIQTNTYDKKQLLNLQIEEPAGIYILNIKSADNNATIRLIKK